MHLERARDLSLVQYALFRFLLGALQGYNLHVKARTCSQVGEVPIQFVPNVSAPVLFCVPHSAVSHSYVSQAESVFPMAQTPPSRSRSNWLLAGSVGLLLVVVATLALMNTKPRHDSTTFPASPTLSAGPLPSSPAAPNPHPTVGGSTASPPATASATESTQPQVPDPCSLVPVPVLHATAGSNVMLVSLARVTNDLTGEKVCVYDPTSGTTKIQSGSQQINSYIMIQNGELLRRNIAFNFMNEAELRQLPGALNGTWVTGGDQISTGKCYELMFRVHMAGGELQAMVTSSGLVDRATLFKVGTPLAQALLAQAGGIAA